MNQSSEREILVGPTEYVTGANPFIVRRRVAFGECDPAGVVYTPRFLDFAISAMHLFLAQILGGDLAAAKVRLGFGTPCKALSAVFHSTLRPGQDFDMRVTVAKIGDTTFDLHIAGLTTERMPVFDASFTVVMVARDGAWQRIPVPEALVSVLKLHLSGRADGARE